MKVTTIIGAHTISAINAPTKPIGRFTQLIYKLFIIENQVAEPQLIIDNYFVAPDDIAAQYCFFYNFVRNLEFFELEILVEEI